MEWDEEIDAIGLLCPLPVLRTRKRMQGFVSGTVIKVLASDPAAQIDMPHFCNEQGHDFLGSEDAGDYTAYFLRKG